MAIALLPLMDGESLPSNFGRYAEYMGLKSTENIRKKLFGYPGEINTRLPRSIDYLADQTIDYWNLSGEEIVNQHTEFRYATMMSSQPTRNKLLRRMLNPPSQVKSCLTISRFDGERVKNLRYCPECIAEWKRHSSSPYWKIDHQLMGSYICVEHFCVLRSVAFGRHEKHGDAPVMALIGADDKAIISNIDPAEARAIEDVAKKSARQRSEGSVYRPVEVYRDMLREAGFFRTTALMRKDAIVAAWSEYFGKEYCYLTGMSASKISSWLSRLTGRENRDAPHPFMFIAAQCFLDHLVSLPGSYFPMKRNEGELDAAVVEGLRCEGALHRNSDVLEFSGRLKRSGGWKIVCTCGISYRMVDSSRTESGKLMPFSYGSRYQNRAHALMRKGITADRVSKVLRLCNKTALKWARRERGDSNKTLRRGEIDRLRTNWRLLVESISSERRITSAAESKPDLYISLLKNDHDWLMKFNSKHRSWRPRSSYNLREDPTTDEIRAAWQSLLLNEPPVRVTAIAILEKAGFWGDRDRRRPFAVLAASLRESRSDYLERVISWLDTLASEHRLISCDDAISRAGLWMGSFTTEQRGRIRGIDSLVVDHRKQR